MRLVPAAVLTIVLSFGAVVGPHRAAALEPDDTPWGLKGTDPAGAPQTIEDLLARDALSIIQDTDIAPPGQDQADPLAPGPGASPLGEDRLTPKLPAEIHDIPARAPDTALAPVDSAPLAHSPSASEARRLEPSHAPLAPAAEPAPAPIRQAAPPAAMQPRNNSATAAAAAKAPAATPALPAQSTAAAAGSALPVRQAPKAAVAAAPAATTAEQTLQKSPAALAPGRPPAPAATAAIGPRPPVAQAAAPAGAVAETPPAQPSATSAAAANQPSLQLPAEPAPAPAQPLSRAATSAMPHSLPPPPVLATAPPAQSTAAREGYDPHAPPPLAVPSSPVSEPSVAVNGKLYLPLRRYFDTKAAVTLAEYDEQDRAALVAHYDKTVGEAMWVEKSGYNTAAKALIEEILKADDWGLASADFKVPGLTRIGGGDFDFEALAEAEVKLSLVAMEYARHARGDRIERPSELLSSYLDRKPQLVERAKLLEGLAAAPDKGAYLRSLHPKSAQFERLRDKLLELRSGQKTGQEVEEIPQGPKLTPGKSHWQVALLRRRLNVAAPLNPDGAPADPEYYDEALARAVVQFKEKSAIEPANATVGSDVRRALNTKPKLDERTILANMEQWRWMPEDLGETYVFVNIPEFLVRVKKHEQIIHEERIVTGRVETQTPIFSDKMRRVVFQPSWNVPESIKINELLPKLREGGNPIANQGLRLERNGHEVDVWDVDWSRDDIRNYHIFQPPGDANVLGVVKFLFPNKHSVYLHDTPSKQLFNEKVRTFSHGCMRVRNPVQLAEVIMAEDKGWDKAKVDDLVDNGPEDNDVTLDHPIPVHVTYFTLWVDDTGEVRQFADVYGHEQRIKLGLEGRWGEIVKNRDHLLPPEDTGRVAAGREDWGDQDEDGSYRQRRVRAASRNAENEYVEEAPRRIVRGPPGPGYRQVYPVRRRSGGISDFFNNIFGN